MIKLRAGSKQLIREINESIVLNAIRTHKALSRTDIAASVGLSLPSVSDITTKLLEAGLIYEQANGISTGGRRPVLLALNAGAGYAIGIKLTEASAIATLTDLEATVVAQHTEPIRHHQPAAVVATLVTAVQALSAVAAGRPIFGVGVGMAGVINREHALVRYATYFDWRDLPLAQLLEEQLDLPVVVDNDVNALTVAEQWFGAGRGVQDFLVISIGRGIGMGMVLDGQLYRGAGGGAGEFGHTIVVPDGPRCACGKHGCLEALISDAALSQRAVAALGRAVTIDEAVDLALQGDAALQAIFASAGHTLGMAVANLVNVLNPALIIIGGEGTRAGSLVSDPFQAVLRAHCFNSLADDLRVVTEPWGDDAWARGAASLLLSELFRPALRRSEETRPSLVNRSR
jgi:predicted NBD/HSP70 family sugar kinase